jgi:uncharacterized protein YdaU (DUF1376 family)
MPMYWDAYLADTTHLTTEEHGAYLLLLAAMWRRNGSVPDNDKDNARILGMTLAKWRKIKARLVSTISGFHAEGGAITQEKLQKTWENTQEKINKNRANGSKGGRPKGNKNKDLDEAKGSISDNPNESIPEPEPEPYKVEDKSSTSQEAEDYQRYLKAHPKPVDSDAGSELFSSLLADGIEADRIISAAAAYAETVKGWSSEAKVQQSDNFLDPERGKWKNHTTKAVEAPSEAAVLAFYADVVLSKKRTAPLTVNSNMAGRLLAAKLVTVADLEAAGLAA